MQNIKYSVWSLTYISFIMDFFSFGYGLGRVNTAWIYYSLLFPLTRCPAKLGNDLKCFFFFFWVCVKCWIVPLGSNPLPEVCTIPVLGTCHPHCLPVVDMEPNILQDIPWTAAATAPTKATCVVGPLVSRCLRHSWCSFILWLLPLSHFSYFSAQVAIRTQT